MQIKTSGFDELEKELTKLSNNLTELSRTSSVSFGELFTSKFMQHHTQFDSLDDFFEAGNLDIQSQEEFEAIPDDVLDKHVVSYTNFSSWQEMLDTASSEYVKHKIES